MTSEDRQQIALFEWAMLMRTKYPKLALLFHIPNERRCTPAEGAILKRKGVKPGVPDLFLPAARGEWHGMFIEMKSETGRIAPAQREWISRLTDEGYKCVVCYGFEQARDDIEKYLDMKGEKNNG